MKDKDSLFLYEKMWKNTDIPTIKEELLPYLASKRQGEYTIEDYYGLPDEYRSELIDGVIYDMAAPIDIHQIIVSEICTELKLHIRKRKGNCIVIMDLDTQLDCDDKTIVRPDILVICDRDKFKDGRVYGAPDLVIEVLSPSTRRKDMGVKLKKYKSAGVKEYWIVDSLRKSVCVYRFEMSEIPAVYTFENEISVGIFEDECKIDFKEIRKEIAFLE